ncbi:TetR/AcrR family transcriptional regulator [Pseudorhodoferax sp. Leaf267]|uniref:TetR/AcrR family transcriptional regulator n=1 Tax=Pseudorhodoferax sp. Leaf267 TaxID=1736316 RepID=UPI0006F779F4|nr:TetR/AcrR family transcriptional regulator [Pseudorhodoferax sp. Leaf267]KQP19783.1 TetR family transcriptional regulator [Pseudorhodoferax sp. Leaf267]
MPTTPTPRKTGAPRARRPDARPGELLASALDLFTEKGFAATRVEEVAARAGVSKGTLFLYFSSKQELFKAVVHKNLASRFVEWNVEYEGYEGSTADMLRYCLAMWWTRVGSTKASGITKLVMSEAHNFPELAAYYRTAVVDPATALIRRILQRGIDSGEFRAVDAEYAVYSVTGVMLYLVTWKHSLGACASSLGSFEPERFIAAQVDLLLNGLRRVPCV